MIDFRQEFLAFALARDVLRFGEFVTKAGRRTPYFFNAGLFNDGESLRRLGRFYADALEASGVACDQLFGPAYKGITLAAAAAIALAERGHNLPFSFNRKEAKDHGEGGSIVGAALGGRVLIVDDVITAGTSVRESVSIDPRAWGGAGGRADRARPDGARAGREVGGAGSARYLRDTGGGDRDARRPDALHRGPAGIDGLRTGDRRVPGAIRGELTRRRRGRERAGGNPTRRFGSNDEQGGLSCRGANGSRRCVARRRSRGGDGPRALLVLAAPLIVAAALAGSATPASAATYKWVDDKGVVHYTDKMPPEAVDKANVELSKEGIPIRKTEKALTPEQRRALEQEQERQRQAARQQEEIARRDRALAASYTSEAEIDLARKRALQTIDNVVQSSLAYSEQLNKRKADAEAKKEQLKGKPVVATLDRELESIDVELARQADAGRAEEARGDGHLREIRRGQAALARARGGEARHHHEPGGADAPARARRDGKK